MDGVVANIICYDATMAQLLKPAAGSTAGTIVSYTCHVQPPVGSDIRILPGPVVAIRA